MCLFRSPSVVVLLTLFGTVGLVRASDSKTRPPNVIVILADDLGYGDLACYGSQTIKTPKIDRMASEGLRWTDFYAAAPFCSPSRAALLTGRYPVRCGVPYVLFPTEHTGLPPEEVTLAELLKGAGYATACIGKWHLGWDPEFRPQRNGFDDFFGLPYSNDSTEWTLGEAFTQLHAMEPLPLMDGQRVIEAPVDQTALTKRYTERAVQFVKSHEQQPFFLYLAHTMPHIPQYVSAQFAGRSAGGLYGDCVEELDWSTGVLLETLRSLNLAEHTLVVFTSDNGAVVRLSGWKSQGRFQNRDFGGSVGPVRGSKGTTLEGGMRVPAIAWWPGRIPAGSIERTMASALDLFPTVTRLAGAMLPADRVYDGNDLSTRWQHGTTATDSSPFYYYFGGQLQAIRLGKWKLMLPISQLPDPVPRSLWYEHQPQLFAKQHRLWPAPVLYDLGRDVSERQNVADDHPEIVQGLTQTSVEFDRRLQSDRRAPLFVDGPRPPQPGQVRTRADNLAQWQRSRVEAQPKQEQGEREKNAAVRPAVLERLRRGFGRVELNQQGHVRLLDQPSPRLTDADLNEIAELIEIESLNLAFATNLTNSGLTALKGLRQLRSINLGGCKRIGDDGIKHINSANPLESINLSLTQVSDVGVRQLPVFTKLRELDLDHTGVTEDGLEHVAKCKTLEYLRLAGLSIGDRGIAQLAPLARLRTLILDGLPITDQCVPEFLKLKQLERLSIVQTQITAAGVAKLRSGRPQLKIVGP